MLLRNALYWTLVRTNNWDFERATLHICACKRNSEL